MKRLSIVAWAILLIAMAIGCNGRRDERVDVQAIVASSSQPPYVPHTH